MPKKNSNPKKMIIYDWDGTLMDSISIIAECLQLSFKELNFSELSTSKAQSIIGLGLIDALEILTPGASESKREELLVLYKKYFSELTQQSLKFFDGVDESLRNLDGDNAVLAVATGKSRAGLERDFKNTNSKDIFFTSRTVDECRPKPDPHMIEDILLETGIDRVDAVMVGDTTFDMEMAELAGIRKIAVAYGAHPVEDLRTYKPDAIFQSFTEMHSWIEKFTRNEHPFQLG